MIYALDDDRVVLEAVADALTSSPYGPVVTSTLWSEIAPKLLRPSEAVDALVCDRHMPGMNGIEFCRILRRHNDRTALILFTSDVEGVPAGVADAVVRKGVPLEQLGREVDQAVARRREGRTPHGGRALLEPAKSTSPLENLAGSIRLLVVEDEAHARQSLRIALRQAGLEVETCATAEEALARLKAGAEYDLVLSDIRMPGMSGLMLLRTVRELLPSLPVVLISAFGSREELREAIRYHCADFVEKPCEPAELVAVVEQALARRQR